MMIRISKKLIFLFVTILLTGCFNFEPEREILEYASTFPNYFHYDGETLEKLERNAKDYGSVLKRYHFLMDWKSLRYVIIREYLTWGKFEKAKQLVEKIGYHQDYGDNLFTVPLIYIATGEEPDFRSRLDLKVIKSKPKLNQFYILKIINSTDIEQLHILSAEEFGNIEKLHKWFYEDLSDQILLQFAARLYGGSLNESESKLVQGYIEFILFSSDVRNGLIDYMGLKGAGPISFWMDINLFYEKFLRKNGRGNEVEKLEEMRYGFAIECQSIKESIGGVLDHFIESNGALPAARVGI